MRKPVAINRVVFMAALAAVEGVKGCKNLGELYSEVSVEYNSNDGSEHDIEANISPSIVKRYIEDESIEIKTTAGKKGSRSKMELDNDSLLWAIETAETEGSFEKRTPELFEAIARKYNSNEGVAQTTSGVVKRTISERNLTLSTPVGKRGRVSTNVSEFVPSDEVMELIGMLVEKKAEFSAEPSENGMTVTFPRELAEQLAS